MVKVIDPLFTFLSSLEFVQFKIRFSAQCSLNVITFQTFSHLNFLIYRIVTQKSPGVESNPHRPPCRTETLTCSPMLRMQTVFPLGFLDISVT